MLKSDENERLSATDSMIAAWTRMAEAIVSDRHRGEPRHTGGTGELLIIGSGIAHIDFTLNDEAEIRAADRVFHCLPDRVSQIWLNAIRPDALDLRILYGQSDRRCDTYVQMAEAMLHCVRRGEKVVAIYYGHPGIFATPAHRALKIARQEGFKAKMRPGISALDYIVADVGFDPMIPGLISYEASDLLLRRRRIDTSLHLVLWQVGMVGEFGFSPQGFANHGFGVLIDALREAYGPDWEITHYIAPQYVGVEPLIERHRIDSLGEESVRCRFGVLSTFYVAPMTADATDAGRSVGLGFTAPGEPVGRPERAYDLGAYGPRELEAVEMLVGFTASEHYAMPGPSPAADFMLELSRDLDLQARYRDDPAGLLADPRYAALTDRARRLLAIPNPLAINAALAEPAAT
jgi:precorrin-3B methylase